MHFAAKNATGVSDADMSSVVIATHKRFEDKCELSISVERGASAAMNSRSGIDLKTSDADRSIAGRYGISDATAGRIVIFVFELFETGVDISFSSMIVEFSGLDDHSATKRDMKSWYQADDVQPDEPTSEIQAIHMRST